MAWLQGYKTYIVAAAAVTAALAAAVNGTVGWPEAVGSIFAAIGLCTVRHGVSTAATAAVTKLVEDTQTASQPPK
jgi:hypothetical protein